MISIALGCRLIGEQGLQLADLPAIQFGDVGVRSHDPFDTSLVECLFQVPLAHLKIAQDPQKIQGFHLGRREPKLFFKYYRLHLMTIDRGGID